MPEQPSDRPSSPPTPEPGGQTTAHDLEAPSLSTDERELIRRLRDEATDVKDCFTRFSFQALVFSSVVLGAIAKLQPEEPVMGLAALPVIVLLLAVSRIGTYKYATANRHFAYELHLHRTLRSQDAERGWQSRMRTIGWEEAMRAWRVVQATAFDHLFWTKPLIPNWLKRIHRIERKRKAETEKKYFWFEPDQLINQQASYHAGSYLKTMHTVLHSLVLASLIPPIVTMVQVYPDFATKPWQVALVLTGFVAIVIFVVLRMWKIATRRKMLEGGFLSIHSCAVMWEAVVLAHYRALEKDAEAQSVSRHPHQDYTRHLSEQAISLRKNIYNIHDWVRAATSDYPERGFEIEPQKRKPKRKADA